MSRFRRHSIAAACGLLVGLVAVPNPAEAKASDYAPGNNAKPAEFSVPPSSTDTAGLTLTARDLHVETLDLVFTTADVDGSQSTSDSNAETNIALSADVLFDFAKSELTAKANTLLDRVAVQLKEKSDDAVTITGYTDSKGSNSVNQPLSLARAQSVANALQNRSGRRDFVVAGKGADDPVAANTNPDGSDNPDGRAQNRRVTIRIEKS